MLSRTQKRAQAVRAAKAQARWNIIRTASEEGLSKLDAAHRAQMTEEGVNSLLFRMVRSTAWPIKVSVERETPQSGSTEGESAGPQDIAHE